jgi:hypothetical protein
LTAVPPGLHDVVALAAGSIHAVALKRDGTVVAWGWNDQGQINVPADLRDVVAVDAGGYHTVALKRDGTVVAWGANWYGQADTPAAARSGVSAISAGFGHTVALKRDGTVLAWGYNDLGQINVPAGLSGVRAISAGWDHTVALKRDGSVTVWGWVGTFPPAALHGLMAIDGGRGHTLALKSSYRFGGFLDPVNALPVVNTVPAGAGVPVSFRLGADQALDIFAEGFPVSRWVSCRADAATDEIEHTVSADHSSLRYDADTGIYTYVWKTDSSWSGQCRRLILRLADGIEHTALFRFRQARSDPGSHLSALGAAVPLPRATRNKE